MIQRQLQEEYSFAVTDTAITDYHFQSDIELLFFSILQNTSENSLKAIIDFFFLFLCKLNTITKQN